MPLVILLSGRAPEELKAEASIESKTLLHNLRSQLQLEPRPLQGRTRKEPKKWQGPTQRSW
jgi:hypothetical protein